MGRGLDGFLFTGVPVRAAVRFSRFVERLRSRRVSGGYGEGETPLPIPNRAVKPLSADGTWPARAWESRSPPVLHRAPGPRFSGTGAPSYGTTRRAGRRCGAGKGSAGSQPAPPRRAASARRAAIAGAGAAERCARPSRRRRARWPRAWRRPRWHRADGGPARGMASGWLSMTGVSLTGTCVRQATVGDGRNGCLCPAAFANGRAEPKRCVRAATVLAPRRV